MTNASQGSWLNGFLSSFSMILASEIGDKTFFIAALMAMRYNRTNVYIGALGALAVMTLLSAVMGLMLPHLLSVRVTKLLSAVLFFIFGFKILYEVFTNAVEEESDEMAEAEEALRQRELNEASHSTNRFRSMLASIDGVMLQAFSLTFLAEWGDRSQIATIALAAAQNPFAVTVGGILGHAICTGMAVIAGSVVSQRVSMRTVSIIGGFLFVVFGIVTLVGSEMTQQPSNRD